ncbi:CaiB/baiF CoA-transferase family protein DDB_G0269880 [Hondaea fermentalgiana]|uniref:CaiB/baiF CoA-transferase family protein DDB_G0269880 n=1 Tax=Hondaea fermentalgiana TaxID=2315210 RepID=A0A2R5FZ57_9STRA|nr:CaiB/baiF CoA-transferase family protein DDB_G0269880 [Hondaea fermentalgiana]|eukprot:GBG24037.1 CaiB/baiF CoA-transferase family protein DDB_G0269880 [Hondaea fermentalgiana]
MASVRLTRAQHYPQQASQPEGSGDGGGAQGDTAAAVLHVALRLAGLGFAAVCAGVVATALARRRARRATAQKRKLASQETRSEDAERATLGPGRGAPLLHGVRVVELSSQLAGPLAARLLGELGAEVIKVEAPEGDTLRDGFGLLEEARADGRSPSAVFEVANLGKASICVDTSTEQGLAHLRGLLRDADVFITNAQPGSLRAAQLDPSALLTAFPHLIYAQVSAWGAHGAGRALSGSDLGAFWAASGLAMLFHERDNLFASLPQGAGDATTAQALVTGIAMALVQRAETGRGQLVDTSLLHAGGWCVGPYVTVNGRARSDTLAKDPLRHVYRTGDGVQLAVCGHRRRKISPNETSTMAGERALREALGLDGPPGPAATNVISAAERRIASLTASQASDLLKSGGIAYQRVRDLREVWAWVAEDNDQDSIAGWNPNSEAALLPRATAAFEGTLSPPLAGCVVVELVDFGGPEPSVCVSAACRVLVERGATVLRIEPRGGDPLRTRDPALYEHYNGGKEVVHVGNLSMEGNTELQRLLETRASIFVTDFAQDDLRHLDLDAASLSSRCANLVVVSLHESRGRETDKGVFGALFAGTGFAHLVGGAAPSSIQAPPRHCVDLVASLHLSAALTLAYFHLKRTNEGQFVHVYLDNIGHWTIQGASSVVHRDARMTPLVMLKSSEYDSLFALPCCRPLRLKDGTWIQLLGVDTAEHLSRTLRALQAPYMAWWRLFWCLATDVLPNRGAPTNLDRARPFLLVVNDILHASASHLDLATFRKRAAEVDLWYTTINRPEQLARHPQARQNTMLEATRHGQDVRVASPCNLLQSPRVAL